MEIVSLLKDVQVFIQQTYIYAYPQMYANTQMRTYLQTYVYITKESTHGQSRGILDLCKECMYTDLPSKVAT